MIQLSWMAVLAFLRVAASLQVPASGGVPSALEPESILSQSRWEPPGDPQRRQFLAQNQEESSRGVARLGATPREELTEALGVRWRAAPDAVSGCEFPSGAVRAPQVAGSVLAPGALRP